MKLKTLGNYLWKGWMKLAHAIGWVNEHILLGLVYFVFIGIYSIFYDLFSLFQRKPKTTWRSFEHQPKTLEDLEKQF